LAEFVDIYEEHIWAVYGFFAYRGLSAQDAEDLTQATFERGLAAWDRFDPERASAGTWLLAIARNIYIDHRRHERSRGEADERVAVMLDMPRADPGPEDSLRTLSPELSGAVSRLRSREREAVALRFGADLRGPEIAQVMGLSLANVQQILSRALRKLRRELVRSEPERAGAGEPDPGDGEH